MVTKEATWRSKLSQPEEATRFAKLFKYLQRAKKFGANRLLKTRIIAHDQALARIAIGGGR